ncbi:hypothetical protein QJS10_CPB21g00775 [Acorus calamus]|uniref:non-specific serine/threonine protein kinase n=1 Tax=Acorus calamus TaxID=4465 RepID=A0AAV9C453_ACOCL|nr:hypothetical protein QJS10_CPB21g00775 [Acorus calamus]
MSQTQSLKDNQTLISAGQSFQLGFFSPGNSTNRYVGIWYYNISPLTVVWVANRDNPIKNSSSSRGVLTFGSNNNLVVLDGDNLLWLLDSGNLVVESSENTVLWQSFDNPSDTFLPGMKVGLDLLTGVNQFFNSWTSEDDPSTGKFSLGISSDRSPQIVIREGHNLHWRTGQWDGQLFTGIANMRPMYLYGFRLSDIEQEHKIYFDYTPINESVFVRFRLSWSGLDEFYYWDTVNAKWETAWAQPISDCEVYNKCGDYGTCRETDAPICTCLQGFVAKDLEGWGRGNWSSGCVRRTPLECERGGRGGDDGFLKLEGVKLLDTGNLVVKSSENTVLWQSFDHPIDTFLLGMEGVKYPEGGCMANVVDEGGCRKECMKNCMCKAYAYVMGIGCVAWVNDLVDIHHFPSGGNGVFLRLDGSETHHKKRRKVWLIILIFFAVSPLKVIFCFYHVKKCWKKKKS